MFPPLLLEADPLYVVEPEIGVFALEAILPLEPETWPCIELPLEVDETDEGGRTDCVEEICFSVDCFRKRGFRGSGASFSFGGCSSRSMTKASLFFAAVVGESLSYFVSAVWSRKRRPFSRIAPSTTSVDFLVLVVVVVIVVDVVVFLFPIASVPFIGVGRLDDFVS